MAFLLSALLVVDDVIGNFFGEHDCIMLVSQVPLIGNWSVRGKLTGRGKRQTGGQERECRRIDNSD